MVVVQEEHVATLSLRARHTATKLRPVAVPSTKMASGVVNATMYVIHLATISWKAKTIENLPSNSWFH